MPRSDSSATAGQHAALAEALGKETWQLLGLAGAPRTSKGDRTKYLERAHENHDQLRAHMIGALRSFGWLVEDVERATAAYEARPAAERSRYDGPSSADKATVTRLRNVLDQLTGNVVLLSRTLLRYRPDARRPGVRSAEWIEASRLRPTVEGGFMPCSWCGKKEGRHDEHITLDANGFACRRRDVRRYACPSCFWDGRDLMEPAPPLAAAPAPVNVAATVDQIASLPAPVGVLRLTSGAGGAGIVDMGMHTEEE